MGLDITAYAKLAPTSADEDSDGVVKIYANPDFPGREAPLKDGALYSHGQTKGFRAGSYSGYTVWRDALMDLASWESREALYSATSGPFFELLYFSDCEGVLGTDVCRKLASEFEKFQPAADAHDDEWFRRKYAQWREAFELASDNGMVDFH